MDPGPGGGRKADSPRTDNWLLILEVEFCNNLPSVESESPINGAAPPGGYREAPSIPHAPIPFPDTLVFRILSRAKEDLDSDAKQNYSRQRRFI